MIPEFRTEYPVTQELGLNSLPEPYVDALPVDGGGNTVTYFGYSGTRVLETDLSWLIVRKTVNGTVTKYEYPGSSMLFNQAWASRATLQYSR